jgi:hypothetical protein
MATKDKLPRLRRIPGVRAAKKEPMPTLTGGDPKTAEREDDKVQRLTRELGGTNADYKLAKRVVGMMPGYPAASAIELVTYDWLSAHQIKFDFQAVLYGGRRAEGGILPDFVVQGAGGWLAWLINGEYWHSQSMNQGRDEIARMKLVGADYKGMRITDMVELWEKDVLRKRPQIFEQALLGIGLRE